MGRLPSIRILAALLPISAGATLVVRRSLVEVRGPSMEPTLWPGDRLVTVPARMTRLRAGQVVVLRDPQDPLHLIVKRICGVTEEGVDVRGDDPLRSTDGRDWGPVPAGSIRRVAITRWPAVLSPLTRAANR